MKLLKEPLFHFLLLGGALFGLDAWTSRGGPVIKDDRRVVIPPERVAQVSEVFTRNSGRPPTADELRELVDDFVIEEISARKARAMGLDQDDTLIRRRLREKLEFLSLDPRDSLPGDEDLELFLRTHPEKFDIDPAFRLRQIFIDRDLRPGDPDAFAREALAKLRAGDPFQGDPSELPTALENANAATLDRTFGGEFHAQLSDLEPGVWGGPIATSFGLHLVFVEERIPGRLPALEDIRPVVEIEWLEQRRKENVARYKEQLLTEFEVIIEWPEPGEDPAEAP